MLVRSVKKMNPGMNYVFVLYRPNKRGWLIPNVPNILSLPPPSVRS